jgi:serine/threonine protein kinase
MDEVFIGRYRLDQMIGRGGLSTVYSAVDTENGQRVAIKIARLPDNPAAHASFVKLFLQEVSLISRLNHSSSVTILDQGTTTDGAPYFVMEFLNGTSLHSILSGATRLSVSVAISIAAQVAGALGAAHSLGFIHRDVKPDNILVLNEKASDSWTVKLLDFGIAAQLNDETGLTQGGGFFGSVHYMSPEQILGKPLSASSDIWQLGVTLFEMLTGSLPFASTGTFETMTAIMNADVASPESLGLPPSLGAFISRCLAKDPLARPRNGQEAANILQEIKTSLVTESFPSPAQISSTSTGAAVQFPTVPINPKPPREMPEPTHYALSMAYGVSLLSFGTLAILSRFHLGYLGVPWIGFTLGLGLVLSGVLFGKSLTKVLAAKRDILSAEAQKVLAGARGRDQLSRTLAIQVDTIAARCRLIDERFLAMTMAVMVDEYGSATTFDDRQKSLMNAVTILEKLTAKLTPWYVRQEKLIALCVTLVGLFSGLVTVLQNIMKLIKKG